MPPRMTRRGSIALSMLDSQSLAPRLESVLSSVNPPSEDAAYRVSRAGDTATKDWASHVALLLLPLVLAFWRWSVRGE